MTRNTMYEKQLNNMKKNIGMETEDMDMADTNISKGDGSL